MKNLWEKMNEKGDLFFVQKQEGKFALRSEDNAPEREVGITRLWGVYDSLEIAIEKGERYSS